MTFKKLSFLVVSSIFITVAGNASAHQSHGYNHHHYGHKHHRKNIKQRRALRHHRCHPQHLNYYSAASVPRIIHYYPRRDHRFRRFQKVRHHHNKRRHLYGMNPAFKNWSFGREF